MCPIFRKITKSSHWGEGKHNKGRGEASFRDVELTGSGILRYQGRRCS